MGEIKGFLKYKRKKVSYRPVEQRVRDFKEVEVPLTPEEIKEQAARCMDCGVPFCHGAGCPVANDVPELNDLIYTDRWRQACEILHSTNNFPEITGRVCPAPCEAACTLSINDEPVLIRHIELQIVERGFSEGWIKPYVAPNKSGRRVAVVGSGPAGLAAAQQLARAGHSVSVFEKSGRCGGLLRYGIPDFKLEKNVIDRRLNQLAAEGVEFQTGLEVGKDVSVNFLKKKFDCLCLAMGAGEPRDLKVSGREYKNIIFALDYLTAQNRLNAGERGGDLDIVSAKDKVVAVIGGGDTGSDCIGTARRQGARQIYQLEILPRPPESRPPDTPWPAWPRIMRTSSSHEEGCERLYSVMTKSFSGEADMAGQLQGCRVEWVNKGDKWDIKEVEGTDFELGVDLVILALGYQHVVHKGIVDSLRIKLDGSGSIYTDNYQTSEGWVFAAGDAVTGASWVTKAIFSGRAAAAAIDEWLKSR